MGGINKKPDEEGQGPKSDIVGQEGAATQKAREKTMETERRRFERRLKKTGINFYDYVGEEKKTRKRHPKSPVAVWEDKAFETQIMQTLRERRQRREVEKLATHDTLTGALNRRGYDARMKDLQKEAERFKSRFEDQQKTGVNPEMETLLNEPFSMITIDIDHFKNVNDTHGHAAGDVVLKEVARRIRDRLRTNDFLARWGGEEFRVIPRAANGSAPKLAEELRKIIEKDPVVVKNEKTGGTVYVNVTISVGVSSYLEATEKMEEYSDGAMYAAKQHGRNCVWIWEKETGKYKPHKPQSP
ncbi:GGDEF domain-containing protein [Candidatus Peregrinibacteria bacterium]|nr:GGDEF domain-containing protein [Candidatus Peregrinibacteria bacterium]